MHLDVRVPAGSMFVLVGGLLAMYGAVSDPAVYQRSLGVNINLSWGVVMIVFGMALLVWRRWSPAAAPDAAQRDGEHGLNERSRAGASEPHR